MLKFWNKQMYELNYRTEALGQEYTAVIPLLSLSENNNRSKILKILFSGALSFDFLTATQFCSPNMEIKTLKGFQQLGSNAEFNNFYTPEVLSPVKQELYQAWQQGIIDTSTKIKKAIALNKH
jgi:hypothetical protein